MAAKVPFIGVMKDVVSTHFLSEMFLKENTLTVQ